MPPVIDVHLRPQQCENNVRQENEPNGKCSRDAVFDSAPEQDQKYDLDAYQTANKGRRTDRLATRLGHSGQCVAAQSACDDERHRAINTPVEFDDGAQV